MTLRVCLRRLESKRAVTEDRSGVTQFHLVIFQMNHFTCPIFEGCAVENRPGASQCDAKTFEDEGLISGKRKVEQEKFPCVSLRIAWLPVPYQAISRLHAWAFVFA